jgi:hypothetical protein
MNIRTQRRRDCPRRCTALVIPDAASNIASEDPEATAVEDPNQPQFAPQIEKSSIIAPNR